MGDGVLLLDGEHGSVMILMTPIHSMRRGDQARERHGCALATAVATRFDMLNAVGFGTDGAEAGRE